MRHTLMDNDSRITKQLFYLYAYSNDNHPVDPSVSKRPIRFKLSVRTENPLLWVSQNLPANEATGHPLTVECKQTKKSMGLRNADIADSTLWSYALEVTNLNVVASNLLRICFKSQSLPNSIIVITGRHLHMFLTLCSQLKFTKMRRRSV